MSRRATSPLHRSGVYTCPVLRRLLAPLSTGDAKRGQILKLLRYIRLRGDTLNTFANDIALPTKLRWEWFRGTTPCFSC
jgi:hypothetical protein